MDRVASLETIWEYDGDGRPVRRVATLSNGDVRTTIFGADGRPESIVIEDASDRFDWQVQTITYDSLGQRAFATYLQDDGSSRTLAFTYDGEGRLTERAVTLSNGDVSTTTFGADGRPDSTVIEDAGDRFDWQVQTITYDSLGQRAFATYLQDDGSSRTLAFTYDADGRLTERAVTLSNGDVRTTTFGADGRPDSTVIEDVSDRFDWQVQTITYDALGQRAFATYLQEDGSSRSFVFVYDAPGNLVGRVETALDGTEDQPLSIDLSTLGRHAGALDGARLVLSGFPSGTVFDRGMADPTDPGRWIIEGADLARLARLEMTPPADWNGTFSLQASVSGTGASGAPGPTATVEITLAAENDAPRFVPGLLQAVEDGPAVSLDLATLFDDIDAEDDGASLVYTIGALPGGGTATLEGSLLRFDPGADFQELGWDDIADLAIEVTATDRHGAATTGTVSLSVQGVNDLPVWLNTTTQRFGPTLESQIRTDVPFFEDGPDIVLDLNAYVFDVDSPDLSFRNTHEVVVAEVQPDGLLSIGSDALLAALPDLTPRQGFVIHVRQRMEVTDGAPGTTPSEVVLHLPFVGVNDAPVIVPGAFTAHEETPTTFDLTLIGDDSDDDDRPHTLNYSVVEQPALGTVSISGGILTFDPGDALELSLGASSELTVRVVARDRRGALSNIQDVVITVEGSNDAPTFAPGASLYLPAAKAGPANTEAAYAFDLERLFTDVDSTSLVITSTDLPGGFSIIDNVLTQTDPRAAPASGNFAFQLRVSDGNGANPVFTLFLEIEKLDIEDPGGAGEGDIVISDPDEGDDDGETLPDGGPPVFDPNAILVVTGTEGADTLSRGADFAAGFNVRGSFTLLGGNDSLTLGTGAAGAEGLLSILPGAGDDVVTLGADAARNGGHVSLRDTSGNETVSFADRAASQNGRVTIADEDGQNAYSFGARAAEGDGQVTVTTAADTDSIIFGAFAGNDGGTITVSPGAGHDTVRFGGSAAASGGTVVVTADAGNDSIVFGDTAGLTDGTIRLTLGTGADTVEFGRSAAAAGGLVEITGDTGADVLTFGAEAARNAGEIAIDTGSANDDVTFGADAAHGRGVIRVVAGEGFDDVLFGDRAGRDGGGIEIDGRSGADRITLGDDAAENAGQIKVLAGAGGDTVTFGRRAGQEGGFVFVDADAGADTIIFRDAVGGTVPGDRGRVDIHLGADAEADRVVFDGKVNGVHIHEWQQGVDGRVDVADPTGWSFSVAGGNVTFLRADESITFVNVTIPPVSEFFLV